MDTDEGVDSDSLSLHKYLYSSADPVNRIDPTGTEDIAELELRCFCDDQLNVYP
jgi:hypothetical protein